MKWLYRFQDFTYNMMFFIIMHLFFTLIILLAFTLNLESSNTGSLFCSYLIHFGLKTWKDARMLYKLTLVQQKNFFTHLLHVNFMCRRILGYSPLALFLIVPSFNLYHFSIPLSIFSKGICNWIFSKRNLLFQTFRNTFPSKGDGKSL